MLLLIFWQRQLKNELTLQILPQSCINIQFVYWVHWVQMDFAAVKLYFSAVLKIQNFRVSMALSILAFDDFNQLCKINVAEKIYHCLNN